jgi:signal transduction histidine kinase
MRTVPILAAAFGALIVLMLIAGAEAVRSVTTIYDETSDVHASYRGTQRALAEIESNIYQSGVLVRDYLLDPSHLMADSYRRQLRSLRAATDQQVDRLRLPPPAQEPAAMAKLRSELTAYWDALDPLFSWTPRQKLALSYGFLHRTVLPRRNAIELMARELDELTKESLARQERELAASEQMSRTWLMRMFAFTFGLGVLVAAASLIQIARLEMRAAHERRRIEQAEIELRRLSQQLVRAQEEERRHLSRELHDHLGQMLTALRVEMGNLERLRGASPEVFRDHVLEAKHLAEDSLRTVRDLAMGLRPSMLDDLGLGPALEWQAREFSRRYGVPVEVKLEGELDTLPDGHRTCIFRVVQEALTNIARHAHATEIRVSVHGGRERASLTVVDNGAGFDADAAHGKGLGMIGIQERVRELSGTVNWNSQPGRGTVLSAEIPVPQPAERQEVTTA